MPPRLLFIQSIKLPDLPSKKTTSDNENGNASKKGSITVPIGKSNQSGGIIGDQFISTQSYPTSANIDDWENNGYILNDLVNIRKIMEPTSYTTKEPEYAHVYMAYTANNGLEKTAHYYILDVEHRFIEVEEVDGEWKPILGALQIKPSTIVDMTMDADRRAGQFQRFAEAYEEYKNKTAQNGQQLLRMLNYYTSDSEYEDINIALEAINSDNVVPFLEDYYKESGYKGKSNNSPISTSHKGIMEKLDNEHDAGAEITMDNKKNVANSLLAAAEEMGLQNTREYRQIKKILDRYEEGGKYADRTDLRGESLKGSPTRNLGIKATVTSVCGVIGGIVGAVLCEIAAIEFTAAIGSAVAIEIGYGGGFAIGAAIGAGIGFLADEVCHACKWGCYKPSDSEKLDENMYKLFEKIQAKKTA